VPPKKGMGGLRSRKNVTRISENVVNTQILFMKNRGVLSTTEGAI
jgi:hypothetical protein